MVDESVYVNNLYFVRLLKACLALIAIWCTVWGVEAGGEPSFVIYWITGAFTEGRKAIRSSVASSAKLPWQNSDTSLINLRCSVAVSPLTSSSSSCRNLSWQYSSPRGFARGGQCRSRGLSYLQAEEACVGIHEPWRYAPIAPVTVNQNQFTLAHLPGLFHEFGEDSIPHDLPRMIAVMKINSHVSGSVYPKPYGVESRFCNSDSLFSLRRCGSSAYEEHSWNKPHIWMEMSYACRRV